MGKVKRTIQNTCRRNNPFAITASASDDQGQCNGKQGFTVQTLRCLETRCSFFLSTIRRLGQKEHALEQTSNKGGTARPTDSLHCVGAELRVIEKIVEQMLLDILSRPFAAMACPSGKIRKRRRQSRQQRLTRIHTSYQESQGEGPFVHVASSDAIAITFSRHRIHVSGKWKFISLKIPSLTIVHSE